jgi:NADH-quinone oxidoreductase subunit N
MFSRKQPTTPHGWWRRGILSNAVIAVFASVTVLLGIFPRPLLDLADHAGRFVH